MIDIIKARQLMKSYNCRNPCSRLQWTQSNKDRISLLFDGIPFICVGTINIQCHQANDVDVNIKTKRAKERDKKEVVNHHSYQCLYLRTDAIVCIQSFIT